MPRHDTVSGLPLGPYDFGPDDNEPAFWIEEIGVYVGVAWNEDGVEVYRSPEYATGSGEENAALAESDASKWIYHNEPAHECWTAEAVQVRLEQRAHGTVELDDNDTYDVEEAGKVALAKLAAGPGLTGELETESEAYCDGCGQYFNLVETDEIDYPRVRVDRLA